MSDGHPLDRPIWNALTSRQSALAIGSDEALRMLPDYGHFAAAADLSERCVAALAALVPANDRTWVLEVADALPPQGTVVLDNGPAVQMIVRRRMRGTPDLSYIDLTGADAVEMRALAYCTKPGPFLPNSHRLGDFIGVKEDGALIAMAGERLKPDGFTEISAVCTLPDHRRRGLAGDLVSVLASRVIERGETPFLHAYAGNSGAIALYTRLGFSIRRMMRLTVLGVVTAGTPRVEGKGQDTRESMSLAISQPT